MITVGDLFEKPKIVLFPDFKDDRFYNYCKEREKEIKKTITWTLESFNVHVIEINRNRSSLPKWKKEWMGSCMTNLGDYLDYLINELDRKKIEDYCKLEELMGEKFISFMPDLVLIMINSYQGAVETDLHWVTDLTLSDSIDISNGQFNFNKLEKYLPDRINEIEHLFEELDCLQYTRFHYDSFKEAKVCFESRHEKASNLLLLTMIEGLVRALGIYLTNKQALAVDPLDKRKYASLDNFLKKIPWKKDLKIDIVKFGLLTGSHAGYKRGGNQLVLANLTERLGFLCRRYKENRNMILHGEDTQYANSLNSFLNFSALKEVLSAIKEYNGISTN